MINLLCFSAFEMSIVFSEKTKGKLMKMLLLSKKVLIIIN